MSDISLTGSKSSMTGTHATEIDPGRDAFMSEFGEKERC